MSHFSPKLDTAQHSDAKKPRNQPANDVTKSPEQLAKIHAFI